MRRPLLSLSAFLLLILPQVAGASMFSLYFNDDAVRAESEILPPPQIRDFVISEMKHWGSAGIVLTDDDIEAAMEGGLESLSSLCTDKVDTQGDPIDLSEMGFAGDDVQEGAGCLGLREVVLSLVRAEQAALRLGDDLLAMSNTSELSMADEPHRPVSVGTMSFLLRRVWSGTGVGLIPWNDDNNDEFEDLDVALGSLDPEQLDAALLRFHYGYFRDVREDDPRFRGIGTDAPNCIRRNTDPLHPEVTPEVRTALCMLAAKLKITGDALAIGEFSTPKLQAANIALWARKDDLGLQWIYPSHFSRLELHRADAYPAIAEEDDGGSVLAYPFSYGGTITSFPGSVRSPLCSRTVGRYGYLCRRPVGDTVDCPLNPQQRSDEETPQNEAVISLVECSEKRSLSIIGPSVCDGIRSLYVDDGRSLTDPQNPGRLNPDLTKADTVDVCSPGTRVTYQDDVASHACYIGLCLAQSMRGHSLVTGRSPVLSNEATSPFLSCVRHDPQLGLYTEAATNSPYPLPTYEGHRLVEEFDREYCLKNGQAARSTLGDCVFDAETVARSPSYDQLALATTAVQGGAAVSTSQKNFLDIAPAIGQRAALEQALPLERKLFAAMADFVRQMADLLTELRRAPLTTVACPWTGPFPQFGT
jgi:hypothetical protein